MNLAKSTFWYSAGNLFSRFIGFILLPLYSHLIPADDFAVYSLIMSAYAVLAAVYQGGLLSGFTKYFLESNDEYTRRRIFKSVFIFISVLAFLSSLLVTVFSSETAKLLTDSANRSDLIIIAAWMLFFDTLYMSILHLLKTLELPGKVVIVSSFSAVINLLLNLYFVYVLHLSIKGILLAQLFSGMFAFLILLPVLKNYLQARFHNEITKSILIFSFPLLIAGILSTMVDVADRFILDSLMDKDAVGIYSFSYRIGVIMNLLVISYRTAWTPLSIRLYNSGKSYSEYFGKSLNKLIALLMLMFITVSLLVDDLFNFRLFGINLLNEQYREGMDIIPFILAGYAFSAIISFYSVYPYVTGKSKYFLITDTICFILNIAINFLLIPIMGIVGAAIATLISYFAGALYLRTISRDLKINYNYNEMIVILFSGFLIFGIGYYLKIFIIDIILIVLFILLSKVKLKFTFSF